MLKRLAAATVFGLVVGYVTAALAATVTVMQKDKQFSQTEITVKKGDTVSFKNDDEVTHNVYSTTPSMGFDLRTQKPGQTSEVTFDHVGRAEVRCAIHPQMKMYVNVE